MKASTSLQKPGDLQLLLSSPVMALAIALHFSSTPAFLNRAEVMGQHNSP